MTRPPNSSAVRPIFDPALAFLVAAGVCLMPGGAFSANGEDGGGNGGLSTEGDEEKEGVCECEAHEDSGVGKWSVTCVNTSVGSIGGIPLGMLGYMGNQLTSWADAWDDWREQSWVEGDGVDPDQYGSNAADGFGEWDSLQVGCEGGWSKYWETLKGDCEENAPTCAPSASTANYTCGTCPMGYELPSPITPQW